MREALRRETAIAIAAGLVGALGPALLDWHTTMAPTVHPMPQVAAGLAPKVFLNAVMSALVPALLVLRQQLRQRPLSVVLRSQLPRSAVVVAGFAVGATLVIMTLLHLISDALSLRGLASAPTAALRAAQAGLVAACLTPATIIILSRA